MDFISARGMAVLVMVAFILLVAVVYQYEKNKDVRKAYNKNYAHAQVEIMARARNDLLTKLDMAERTETPVSLKVLVKETDEAMSIIDMLDIMPGDFVKPRVKFMTYQDAVLFIFSSKDSDVEVDLLYPKSKYILP